MNYPTFLKAGVAPLALGLALTAAPAFAQEGTAPAVSPGAACDDPANASNPECATADDDVTIVVTGSILRTNKENANPVTVISADELNTRGVTTVEDAIQNLAANGAGTLPNSFTANGAFAAGASAASLRGLTTSSTLVLFDGLRGAYYPLADDGTRNFVDLNTIPDAIVDRVEVLKDGASATYGADAIAGVINIITKKEVKGLYLQGEAGISERGDAAQQNLALTYGVGDLAEDGFNVYVSGRYFNQEALYNRDRDYPFNTDDYTDLCNAGGTDCVQTGVINGREFDGSYSGFTGFFLDQFYASPYDTPTATGAGRADGYRQLTPGRACAYGTTTLTGAELAQVNADGPLLATNQVCQSDITNTFGVIQPHQERINGSIRATANLSDTIQGYFEANYARSEVDYSFYNASAIRSSAPAESGITYNVSPLYLPIYLCDDAQVINRQPYNNGCTAASAGSRLNPNNPFAAQGQYARIIGNLPDIVETSNYKTDSFRIAGGVSGTFGDGRWLFDVGATAMKVDLERTLGGRVYIANFLEAVATGAYNFVDPSQNSQAVRDFVAPTIRNRSTSELYMLQANVSRDLFDLPGGPLQVGVGGAIRNEKLNAPGADTDNSSDPNLVDPTQRYTSRVNPFGSSGDRTVYSAFIEADAPVFDFLNINAAGRYDKYSTGQDYFSPKVGVQITPIRQVKLRGTYSRGFRIGSFAEFGATPTTGYIPATATIPDAIQDQYAAANGGNLPSYITNYSLGLTQSGNPDLQPEKSESFTAGIVAEPIRGLSFTVDYYQIEKKGLIVGADYTGALAAYYAGQPIPDGFNVIADDPLQGAAFEGLIPRAQFVQYSFVNKDSQKVRGIDFGAAFDTDITNGVRFSSSLEASYLIELSQTVDGEKQEYAGSLGPFAITSGAGSPEWRGSWQNTLDFGQFFVSGTVFYTDGYKTTAEDVTGAGTIDDCSGSLSLVYAGSQDPYQCSVDSFIYGNLSLGFDVNDNFRFYFNINNVTDERPPLDTATYGGHLYNPAYANAGILGRYFKAGIKANF